MAYGDVGVIVASIAVIVAFVGILLSNRKTGESNKLTMESNLITRKVMQTDLLMQFRTKLEEPVMLNIAGIIAEDGIILQENSGPINEHDLVRYLSVFNEINQYLNMGVLEIEFVAPQFINYVIPLSKNKEVLNYVEQVRTVQNPTTWGGVYKFAKIIEDLSKQLKSKK